MPGPDSLTVFKRIFVPSELEEAALETLAIWYPTYIRELESQLGLTIGDISAPSFFTNRNSFDVLPGEKYPKVVAISPGIADTPMQTGGSQYTAQWRLGVGVVCAADSETLANMMVKIYTSAARAIILQKQSLGGIATNVAWINETYEDLQIANQNQLFKASSVEFLVEVQDIVTKRAGPKFPDHDPYVYGKVEKVIIEIEKKEIG
jgi:hypothetical protein